MKTNQWIAQAITQKLNSNSGVTKTLTAKNEITLLTLLTLLDTVLTTANRLADQLQSKLKDLQLLR